MGTYLTLVTYHFLESQVQGGGNCANALTAAARLGLTCALISKIGRDGAGDTLEKELQEDGVLTTFLLRSAAMPSPSTYIIVDRESEESYFE